MLGLLSPSVNKTYMLKRLEMDSSTQKPPQLDHCSLQTKKNNAKFKRNMNTSFLFTIKNESVPSEKNNNYIYTRIQYSNNKINKSAMNKK